MRNWAAGDVSGLELPLCCAEVCEVRGEGNSGGVVQSNCGTGASRSATLGCGDPGGSSGAGRGPGLPSRARLQSGGCHNCGMVGKKDSLELNTTAFYSVRCPKL